MRRVAIYLLASVLLTLSSCKMIDKAVGKTSEPSGPVLVKVVPVTVSEAVSSASYVGTVEPARQATLSAVNSGTLVHLKLKKGDRVRQGQVVARIESQQVRSAYEMAESKLAQAEDAYARLQKVNASGSVAPVRMVEVETALAQARAMKSAAQKSLSNCTLKAPFSGIVEDVYAQEGVELGIAAPIVRIVDISSVEIHFPIPENEMAVIATGDAAKVEIPALGRGTTGVIAAKGVVASALSHNYDCTLGKIADASGLMPGMVCKVFLERGGVGGVILPAGCVMTDMEGRYVWTVTDGVVGKNHVTVAGYSGDGIIIGSGLEGADAVVVEGARKVSTGMKVEICE